jgi:hypothetical protein
LKIHNVFVPTYNSENQKGKFLPQAARKYQSALEEKKKKKNTGELRMLLDLHNAY